ncbi:hypothetical protein CcI156_09285 [Frankia sp. CcI156]|jgi:hypothetical protein|uniref:Uncharacterized protein n=1 Tax=Frankia casuarinae (strain DSM 45818 / CECT 9043 / HFP020203 / CcI3) TaxID=106370 RepID=Q2JAG6_FRACC|nr:MULTISPECIES: hypothetical protein [Frankia]ABD11726.1 hypothetical protein Francci3_2359 [Frankia casuarinae]ETA03438.1 hypothetical protein CcI6DRAFT_01154 [Frankia sp. CcI6]EYT93214.1 hypothetical protein ThrDRAFT_01184 [Frankia casuarinae]KFB03591.1 hypothetical protein ALLO2DRAFT_03633 [Frankia sp. Allo2]OAA26797.1 hypothetical protein AAY23_102743 [Frankia casuarinae]
MENTEESVVGGLTAFEWHDATAASCETAVEEINQVVGGYASLVSAAADDPGGSSPTDVAGWRQQMKAFADLRRELRPDDPQAVTEARRASAAALRYLESMRGQ